MIMKIPTAFALVVMMGGAGCSRGVDLESVADGSEVDVIRQDGGVVRGTLAARDDERVEVDTRSASLSIARDQIAAVRVVGGAPDDPLPAIATFRELTLPADTRLTVRLESAVASDTGRVEDPVEATLTNAVIFDGIEVLSVGSRVHGVISSVEPAGKVKGRATLALQFDSIVLVASDDRYPMTAHVDFTAPATRGQDAAKIAIPAAAGAVIGGLAGGKKGAAVGTAVGGGAGAAVVLSTSGQEIRLPVGTIVTLALVQAIDVRVPIDRLP